MKILIVDDHFVIRQGVKNILHKSLKNVDILHEGTLLGAMEVVQTEAVDLVILDVCFPEGSSLKYVHHIKEVKPDCKILIFTTLSEEKQALPFIYAGAHGYLDKISSETEIQHAVKTILETGKYFTSSLKEKILNGTIMGKRPLNLDILADREMQVARLLVKGEGNLEISNSLNLQKSTVSTYKKRILQKLEINNVMELAEIFRRYGEGT
ncbi:MAG: response regulator transcription factor [Sediminicola sp.]